MSHHFFSPEQFAVIFHCAKECEHQGSGEMSVAHMLSAWDLALGRSVRPPGLGDVAHLGAVIEPKKNPNGYRNTPVEIGGSIALAPRLISQAMESLFEAVDRLTPAEFYREFEEIHPFIDGNGRVGNILFNWLRGTLHDPVFPPDFWNNNMEGTPS